MATVMPQNVRVRLNVGGTTFHTSLHTVMEGARRGSPVFQCLCAQILGPQANGAAVGSGSGGLPWEQRVVSAQNEQYRLEHFVDADPAPVPAWLEHLRTGHVKFVEAGPLREEIISDTQRAGFVELAAALRDLVDYRRVELQQALYMRPGAVNLGGAMLRGQDLSKLCFAGCSLRNTDLRGCNLQKCSFVGADLRGANLKGADLTGADLTGANMSKTDLSELDLSNVDIRRVDFSGSNLNNARLPAFDSGQLAGVNYNGASLHGTGLTELTFQSPFDCNGALYYIATGGGERAYASPHDAGLVVASMSSIGNDISAIMPTTTEEERVQRRKNIQLMMAKAEAKIAASTTQQAARSQAHSQETLDAIAAADRAGPAGPATRQEAQQVTSVLCASIFEKWCQINFKKDIAPWMTYGTAEPDGACGWHTLAQNLVGLDGDALRRQILEHARELWNDGVPSQFQPEIERALRLYTQYTTFESWFAYHNSGCTNPKPWADELCMYFWARHYGHPVALVSIAKSEMKGIKVFNPTAHAEGLVVVVQQNGCHFAPAFVKAVYRETMLNDMNRWVDERHWVEQGHTSAASAEQADIARAIQLSSGEQYASKPAPPSFMITSSVLEQDRKAHEVIAEDKAELEAPIMHDEHSSPEQQFEREQLRMNAYVKRALAPEKRPVLAGLSVDMPTDAAADAPWGSSLDQCREARCALEATRSALHTDAVKRVLSEEEVQREAFRQAAKQAAAAEKRVAVLEQQLANAQRCQSDTGKACHKYDAENEAFKKRLLDTEKLKNDQHERANAAVDRAATAEKRLANFISFRLANFMQRAATAERHVLVQRAFDCLKCYAGGRVFKSTYVDSFDQYIARRITGEAFRGWWSVRRDVQEVQDQSKRVAELEEKLKGEKAIHWALGEVNTEQHQTIKSLQTQVSAMISKESSSIDASAGPLQEMQEEMEALKTELAKCQRLQQLQADQFDDQACVVADAAEVLKSAVQQQIDSLHETLTKKNMELQAQITMLTEHRQVFTTPPTSPRAGDGSVSSQKSGQHM